MSNPPLFCTIDEAGHVLDEQKRLIKDPDVIEEFFANLTVGDSAMITSLLHGQPVIVEAYDAPIVAHNIHLEDKSGRLTNIYGLHWEFKISDLLADEWDRFHGLTSGGIPFVLNRQAQEHLFNQLEGFTDDSVTFAGITYSVASFWNDELDVESGDYWTDKYLSDQAGWDLGTPATALQSMLPKLKLPASKIIVLGGGRGHDAALFAEQGHHVTLVDISPEALNRAQHLYGNYSNLTFLEADIFNLPHEMFGQFDIVFEHTCFCAVNPNRRNDLIRQWRRLLNDKGFLLGIFFTMPKRSGPPFGGSEWELNSRLKGSFTPLIWQRYRQSIKPRLGRELLVYAQKKA